MQNHINKTLVSEVSKSDCWDKINKNKKNEKKDVKKGSKAIMKTECNKNSE